MIYYGSLLKMFIIKMTKVCKFQSKKQLVTLNL